MSAAGGAIPFLVGAFNPVVAVCVAVGAAIALLITHFDDIKKKAKGMWDAFKDTGAGKSVIKMFDRLKVAFSTIGEFMKNVGKSIADVLKNLGKDKSIKGLLNTLKDFGKGVKSVLGPAIEVIANTIGSIASKVAVFIGQLNEATGFWEKFKKAVSIAIKIAIFTNPLVVLINTVKLAVKMWNKFKNLVKKAIKLKIVQSGFDVVKKAIDKVSDVWKKLVDAAKKSPVFKVIGKGFDTLINWISKLKSWWNGLKGGSKTFNVNKNEKTSKTSSGGGRASNGRAMMISDSFDDPSLGWALDGITDVNYQMMTNQSLYNARQLSSGEIDYDRLSSVMVKALSKVQNITNISLDKRVLATELASPINDEINKNRVLSNRRGGIR